MIASKVVSRFLSPEEDQDEDLKFVVEALIEHGNHNKRLPSRAISLIKHFLDNGLHSQLFVKATSKVYRGDHTTPDRFHKDTGHDPISGNVNLSLVPGSSWSTDYEQAQYHSYGDSSFPVEVIYEASPRGHWLDMQPLYGLSQLRGLRLEREVICLESSIPCKADVHVMDSAQKVAGRFRDQIESFKSVLKTARAIPLDKSSIMHFTEFLEKKLAELASKHAGPFGRMKLGQWPYEIRTVDGTEITTYVRFETVPTKEPNYVLDGGVGFLRGTPIVVVQINGSLDADAIQKGSETHIVKIQLYNLLLHEFTHVADKYTRGVGQGGRGLTEEQLRNNPAAYYNNPSEMHAYMQEVVDQVSNRFVHYEKLRSRFGQKALGMLLNMSDTWIRVSPYWTERNRQKVLKAVYQALADWEREKTSSVINRYKYALAFENMQTSKSVTFTAYRWDETIERAEALIELFHKGRISEHPGLFVVDTPSEWAQGGRALLKMKVRLNNPFVMNNDSKSLEQKMQGPKGKFVPLLKRNGYDAVVSTVQNKVIGTRQALLFKPNEQILSMELASKQASVKTADVLTKSWLMGVRRGWLKVWDRHPRDWADIHESFDTLKRFLENLKEQLFFARRGPYTGVLTMTEGQQAEALIKQLLEAVGDERRKAEHWDSTANGRNILPGFRQEEGLHMLSLYKKDFFEAAGGKEMLKIFDKLMKLLREDAQRVVEHNTNNPEDPFQDKSVFKQFDLYGMKVVIDDRTVTPTEIKRYINFLDEAYARMKAKGFAKAWYGTVFIQCESCGGVNQNGPDLGVGGNYHIDKDTVQVFIRPGQFIVELMAHELGHRYWFKQMSSGQRERFKSLIKVRKGPKPTWREKKVYPEEGKWAVDKAVAPLREALKDFAQGHTKWWKDTYTKFETLIPNLAWDMNNAVLDAMHKPGANATINPEVKGLFEDALNARGDLLRACQNMQDGILDPLHKEPEPAKRPKNLDKYWWEVFDKVRDHWIKAIEQKIDEVVATAYIYIDASVQAFNKAEADRVEQATKNWETELDGDTRPVTPVSDYGQSNIDEAWAEVFAHYVMDKDMTRDQIESFKSVLKMASAGDSASVVKRYKAAMAEVTPESVDKWRRDLKLMTKIYKSIDLDSEVTPKETAIWEQAQKLFVTFKNNWEHWVYKIVLPKVEKGQEGFYHRDIAKQAWDARYTIDVGQLFPSVWDGDGKSRKPAPWELKGKRDQNIKRYQTAFNKALKTIDEYLDTKGNKIVRDTDEVYDIAGMTVVVQGYGRELYEGGGEADLDRFLRNLKAMAQPMLHAGFKRAIDGVRIIVNFDPAAGETLTNAQYSPSQDRMMIYPLGMAGMHESLAQMTGTFTHEMGHRYWFKQMGSQGRAAWNEGLKNPELLSDYAADGDPVEGFAEAFRLYCTKGPQALNEETLDLFKRAVGSGGVRLASIVVARFKTAERSKKVKLGFRIVDIRTGEAYTKIVPRKDDKLREQAKKLHEEGKNVGIQTVEVHVPESWKKGDPLEQWAPKDVLEGLQ